MVVLKLIGAVLTLTGRLETLWVVVKVAGAVCGKCETILVLVSTFFSLGNDLFDN